MEDVQLGQLWDISEGDFFDQPFKVRTAQIPSYFCPSQNHDSLTVLRSMTGSLSHSHPAPDEGDGYYGSVADYMASMSSTCAKFREYILPPPLGTNNRTMGDSNSTPRHAYFADGAIVPVKVTNYRGNPAKPGATGNYPQGIISYSSKMPISKITDGTSKTLMFGEISEKRAAGFQAFNGDDSPSLFTGQHAPLAPFPDREPQPEAYLRIAGELKKAETVSFGSSHPSVVMFVMVDGSVQAVSRDIDPTILDLMAQRDDGQSYDINGTGPTCNATAVNPF
jgi:hypothetical protein